MAHRALLLALVLAAAVATDARACSCVPPEHLYERAKVAFIGTVVERTADRTAIDVERALKGHVNGRVTYEGTGPGASSCEPEIEVGERIGVMAAPGGDLNLCNTTEASELERIAQPLPVPDGVEPAAFLVGGPFKEHGVAALDARGRILRYGPSIGFRAAACPGGQTVVGVDGSALKVMRISDLKVLRRLRAGGATHVRCLDATGRRVVSAGDRGPLSIWTGARRRVVRVSRAQGPATLGQRRAVFATGPDKRARVTVIDYTTRRARTIHTTSGRLVHAFALSPDERRVLVASSAIERGSEIRVVPVGRGKKVSSTALEEFKDRVDVVWPTRGRILLALERQLLHINAATLTIDGRTSGWGYGVVIRGGTPYGLTDSGELVTSDFRARRVRTISLLPRARVGPLIALAPPAPRATDARAPCRWRGIPRTTLESPVFATVPARWRTTSQFGSQSVSLDRASSPWPGASSANRS